MPSEFQPNGKMPTAGEKFSPFGRVPGTQVRHHSPFTKSGHAAVQHQTFHQEVAPDFPKVCYHSTLGSRPVDSQEQFDALGPEWSLTPQDPPVPEPVAPASSPAGMDRVMQSFD